MGTFRVQENRIDDAVRRDFGAFKKYVDSQDAAYAATDAGLYVPITRDSQGAGAPGGTGSNGWRYWDTTNFREYRSDGTGWIIMYEPWQTFAAPVLTQGVSVNIAKTVQISRYQRIAGTVTWAFRLDATAGGTAGSIVTVSTPIASSHTVGTPGVGMVFDASAGQKYVCHIETPTTGTIAFGPDGVFGNAWGATPSIAIASGDQFRGQVTYQMSSPYL